MSVLAYGPGRSMQIDPAIVQQMAQATVKTIVEAIVELVTNSDDSYGDLEDEGLRPSGRINIRVARAKGGQCKSLAVIDEAAGMSKDDLDAAIVFAKKTSSFHQGRRRRGLLGRGLKEAIVALGSGEIVTIRDNVVSGARVWWDREEGAPKTASVSRDVTPDVRRSSGLLAGNGTAVSVDVKTDRAICPELDSLTEQIERHYALNDILDRREVWLAFERVDAASRGRKPLSERRRLKYARPKCRLVREERFQVGNFDCEASVKVYESEEGLLESPRQNPYGRAGLRIKSDGAIIDNTLFGQSDQAACYFLGEVVCDGIAERIRAGDYGLINQNRGGVEWGHPFCRALAAGAERVLEEEVQRKKRELNVAQRGHAADKVRRKLQMTCALLNKLAKEELSEDEPPPPEDVTTLEVVPKLANVPYRGTRVLSLYAPVELARGLMPEPVVRVSTSNKLIPLLRQSVDGPSPVDEMDVVLHPHPRYPDKFYYSWFEVRGDLDGQAATVSCRLDKLEGIPCVVKVAEPRKVGKRRSRPPRKGGMFTSIEPDAELTPYQRVYHDSATGIIWVFVNFPGIEPLLDTDLKGIATPEGSMLCAELVLEAFCRVVAERNFRRGHAGVPKADSPAEAALHAVFTEVQKLQQKYAAAIYDALVVRSP